MTRPEVLLDLLDARAGVVCAVGAGGKKSLLMHLAKSNPARTAITATVFTTYAPEQIGLAVAIDEDDRLPAAVASLEPSRSVAYACPGDKPGRRAGASAATIERIHREGGFVATYVKADGARMRLVKAPAQDEPALPACCTTVVPILSALAIGEPLTARVAHRVERIERVAGLRENEILTAAHVGRLLASPEGLMKATEGRRVVPVINMVDDAAREAQAREAAAVALDLCERIDRVVLVCLARAGDPVVGVVRRGPGRAHAAGTAYNPRMGDVVVRIPAPLRAFAGGEHELRAAAGTVGDVLRELAARHPQLVQRLLTPDGELRPFVNVFVGRANVRGLSGLATAVPAGEVVSILPAVAGG